MLLTASFQFQSTGTSQYALRTINIQSILWDYNKFAMITDGFYIKCICNFISSLS